MKIKTIMLIILGLILVCSTASATVEINNSTSFPYTMDVVGETYILTENISTSAGALIITKNNTVLDGQGYTILYGSASSGVCINSNWANNGTIKNVNIICQDSSTGAQGFAIQNAINFTMYNCSGVSIASSVISLSGASNSANISNSEFTTGSGKAVYIEGYNSTLTNVSGQSTSYYGIAIAANANNNTFINCYGISGSSHALDLGSATNNSFSGCYAYCENSSALFLSNSTLNTFTNCTGYSSKQTTGGHGVALVNSSLNTFIGLNGSSDYGYGIYITGSSASNNFSGVCCAVKSDNMYSGVGLYFDADAANTNDYSGLVIDGVLANNYKSGIQVLQIGDSITAGGAAGFPYGAYGRYANISLNTYASYNFAICGVGSQTAATSRIRFLDEVQIYSPDIVTILSGANDLGSRDEQNIIDDILWMANESINHNAIPYILLAPARNDSQQNNTIALNQNLSQQAASLGIRVINVYDIIDIVPYNGLYDGYNVSNYVDNIHPNQAANADIGSNLARNILALNSIYYGSGLYQTIGFNGEVLSSSREIYPTDTVIPFSVIPTEDWVRVNISTWETNYKVWTEDMDSHDGTTTHVIGGFPANTDIDIYRDGIDYATVHSNSAGYITWIYSGGFSEHTFEAVSHATAGMRDSFVDSWGNTVSMVGAIIVIALAGSMIAVFRGKREITDLVNDLPGIVLIVVLLVVGAIIFGQF